jgi:acyl carrier protein
MTPAIAREEIGSKLRSLLGNQPEIQIDVDTITDKTVLEEVGFDSLSILDFMYEMEDHFGVQMEIKDLLEMDSVGDLVEHLQGKLA